MKRNFYTNEYFISAIEINKNLVDGKIIQYLVNMNIKLLIFFGSAALPGVMLDLGILKIIWVSFFLPISSPCGGL